MLEFLLKKEFFFFWGGGRGLLNNIIKMVNFIEVYINELVRES